MTDFDKWRRFDAAAAEEAVERKCELEESTRVRIAREQRALKDAQHHAATLKSKATVTALRSRQRLGRGRRQHHARTPIGNEVDKGCDAGTSKAILQLQNAASEAERIARGLEEVLALRDKANLYLSAREYVNGARSAREGLRVLEEVQGLLLPDATAERGDAPAGKTSSQPSSKCPNGSCSKGNVEGHCSSPSSGPGQGMGRETGLLRVVSDTKKACYMTAAACLSRSGRVAEATETLRDLLLEDPNNVPAWMARGEAFQAMGTPLLAELHLERALALEPGNKEASAQLKTMQDLWGERGQGAGAAARAGAGAGAGAGLCKREGPRVG
ncbi:unnamed protein product, partial [Discosporangium mesarthrocarpum]